MSFSYKHEGNQLPITLDMDETTVEQPCPLCSRAEQDGVVRITAARERMTGMTTARCTNGHMVMVRWQREGSAG